MGASPTDRANLAPVDIADNRGWLRYLAGVFTQTLIDQRNEARGESAADLNPYLSVGYVYAIQNGAAAVGALGQGYRGHQTPLPTPQELIRQVTGVGIPSRGR